MSGAIDWARFAIVMKNVIWWLVVAILGVGIGGGLHLLLQHEGQLPSTVHTKTPSTPEMKVEQPEMEQPEIRHPIEQVQLPPTDAEKSDTPETEVQEEPFPRPVRNLDRPGRSYSRLSS